MSEVDLPHAEFAFPGPLRDRLVAAIQDGRKTTTTALLVEFEHADEPLPRPGDRELLIDSAGAPAGVIELLEVRCLRLADVDLAHAVDEGEGHASVADWRTDHEEFWQGADLRAHLGDPEFTVDDDTMVVAQRFRFLPTRPNA
ncbi:uncharacterized protein YhfF [Actinoalloteichus hoggarensis]|uniref:ASCH domain protein n=1 Tax=Actinoalloteichus hoggarensis TaxID=1470176 RepID=A0A221W062_9PSEU|nr:ASCH domain-containing protein [Actinoalloteichus hoggarensis]ASO19150.1 ASCH domain protein [Actinoalloteichus hoggarensis]MBB5920386.1 uncharacterized protein YhfF [Actinoalloteichus hoggarensis]